MDIETMTVIDDLEATEAIEDEEQLGDAAERPSKDPAAC